MTNAEYIMYSDKIYTKNWVQHTFSPEQERKYHYIVSKVGNPFPLFSLVKIQTFCHINQRIFTWRSENDSLQRLWANKGTLLFSDLKDVPEKNL